MHNDLMVCPDIPIVDAAIPKQINTTDIVRYPHQIPMCSLRDSDGLRLRRLLIAAAPLSLCSTIPTRKELNSEFGSLLLPTSTLAL